MINKNELCKSKMFSKYLNSVSVKQMRKQLGDSTGLNVSDTTKDIT